ncbi:hypothetical protein GCK72_005498 [Caenorhabditis remanei]|uniref:Mannosyltransferase n=2 Tax=Caenorhabditis remanei TaxID=31234 RepID=A0A6A5HFR8_CAERE|nr:hypothetical protein GCK72_005498 [Caenorhabditis remanei]KAF1765546.1 hypothetical protein GCK72_005498 [Caenorhabditis remanei]
MTTRQRRGGTSKTSISEKEPAESGGDIKAECPDTYRCPMFLALFLVRLLGACSQIINDCDEVYNYWEPLHLFLYEEGFQTWEYSPIYAIRSYFYIYLHYIPIVCLDHTRFSKATVFLLVRGFLAIFCCLGELYAYKAIAKNIRTGRVFFIFTMFSSGVFQASPAFLPSSFCMTLTYFTLGAFLNERWTLGIFCVAFSTLVGWPFVAVLGLPFVVLMLYVKDLKFEFIVTSLLLGSSTALVQFLTDSYYFGKPVVASLNIVLYNVLSGPGPSLYGEESIIFYIKNLILNWNVAIFAFFAGVPLSFIAIRKALKEGKLSTFLETNTSVILLAVSAALWMVIFGAQAHKEERFLFPIYPLIAFIAAIVYEHVYDQWLNRISFKNVLICFFFGSFVLLSASRSFSVYRNYSGHVNIYSSLNEELGNTEFSSDTVNRVCVGKEWHRFPSSFFIPKMDHSGRKVEFHFLQSEFRGLLPKPFKRGYSRIDSTRHEPTEMNNLNKEEVSRYVDLDSCNYVIDVDMSSTEFEPNFRNMSDKWMVLASHPFIDVSKSSGFAGLLRAFYIPYFSEKVNKMTTYTLYRRIIIEK